MGWQRALTGIERWHWLFDRAAPMNLVFVARLEGRIDVARLQSALAATALHYPTLTARIEPARRPFFVATDKQVPVRVVPWSSGAWRERAVDEANRRVPATTGPLARVVVLDGTSHSDLLFSFNQAMADGLSGIVVLDEILTVYGGGARPALPAPEVLDPPLDGLLGTRYAALTTTLREIPVMRRLTPIAAAQEAHPEQRHTALLDVQLQASFTNLVARRAATHGTSVHGALAAALLLAIGAELRGKDHARRDEVGCATVLDLRRRTELPAALVGTLLSRVVSSHSVHYDTLFWDLAAEVSGSLREATATGAAYAHARMTQSKAIGVRNGALPRRIRRAERLNRVAAVVNNLGRVEIVPRYGDVTVERLGFLVSANAYVGSSLVLSAVTFDDTTSLNFTFAEPLMGAERAQRLVDDTLTRLHDAVR
ncbi:MAG: hypothetical protein PVJ49_20145 [Acidobacteriota bacterium]|jgi:hypothetical protein